MIICFYNCLVHFDRFCLFTRYNVKYAQLVPKVPRVCVVLCLIYQHLSNKQTWCIVCAVLHLIIVSASSSLFCWPGVFTYSPILPVFPQMQHFAGSFFWDSTKNLA